MKSTRRAFFRNFGGIIASVAVAQGVVRKLLNAAPSAEVVEWVSPEYTFPEDVERMEFSVSPWIGLFKADKFPDSAPLVRGVK